MIPGCNDSEEELREMAARLSRLPSVKRVDLICYHQFGMVKYQQLDRPYPMPDSVQPIPEKRQRWLLELFRAYGLNVQLGG